MAQSTILAAGNTAATSTDIVVATGVRVTVGVFGAANTYLPSEVVFPLMIDTPNGDNVYASLQGTQTQVQLVGPGTWRVLRPLYVGAAFGVWLET